MTIQLVVFLVVTLCSDVVDTNILEDIAASIFRVKRRWRQQGPSDVGILPHYYTLST